MTIWRAATLLEELDVEGCTVEHRRGELYRLAAKRIRELEAAARPEAVLTDEKAASLLRQFSTITKRMKDAVWYDKDENRHPAVTPLYEALAEEVNAYLPQVQR